MIADQGEADRREAVERLKTWLDESDRIVFFGGAGVSTESGIPDFRGVDGLYHQQYRYPPETIISRSFYRKEPAEFYRFYKSRMVYPAAKPGRAHLALAELEESGTLKAVITQNIDGLHQEAGSQEVLELHGSVRRNFCLQCGKNYGLLEFLDAYGADGIPRCSCGGMIKPDVVLYEEPLAGGVLDRAVSFLSQADMLIVGGTSLTVYPAAGLLDFYGGNRMVLINKTVTGMDERADLVISGSIGEALGKAVGL